jgi:hypothetical protein
MKTIKILAVILGVLAAFFLALHFAFSPNTETVAFEYRNMPYNFIIWRVSDGEGNNPVMNYCLLEEADNKNLTFTILQDFSETAYPIIMELKLKVSLSQGMLESFDMKDLLSADDITSDLHYNADFNTNRLSLTVYVYNNRDGKEEPRISVRAIREKPTWLYSNYLTDMVVLLPYINTGTSVFSAGFLTGNNYPKLVFKRTAAAYPPGRTTYQFSPYGIFGVFSGFRGEFTLNNNGSYIELERLSCTQKTGLWKDLLITVLGYQSITNESFDSLRETLLKGEKVNF